MPPRKDKGKSKMVPFGARFHSPNVLDNELEHGNLASGSPPGPSFPKTLGQPAALEAPNLNAHHSTLVASGNNHDQALIPGPSHPRPVPEPAGGYFNGAHGFIYNVNMNGVASEDLRLLEEARKTREDEIRQEERARRKRKAEKEEQTKEEERALKKQKAEDERRTKEALRAREAFAQLIDKAMPSAMLDSIDRGYIPRCNEDTRRSLRARIVDWAQDDSEAQSLLWLSGPAGVGKSAVAQTVAEAMKAAGLLGGAFFFSRPNNRSDPNVVIPTLVYQLALNIPDYRNLITQRLIEDPLLLNRSRATQFEELIVIPFRSLASRPETATRRLFLIVIDGIDECRDREAQRELVEMISRHMRAEGEKLWLRWLLTSRPEPDLKVAFSNVDCKTICRQEKLAVEDSEAQRDARRILDAGFAEIRRRYPDQLADDWPAEDEVCFIAHKALGHLGFASFVLRFIGDIQYDDPAGQLEVCLKFLKHAGTTDNLNPLHLLDALYTQILSDIPLNILPTTRRILGFILFSGQSLEAGCLANFLGLSRASFYRALQRLHSVVVIPPASNVWRDHMSIYHASFSDYLKDPIRSEKFCLDEGTTHLDIVIAGLKWLPASSHEATRVEQPAWIPPTASYRSMLDTLSRVSLNSCWKSCLCVPRGALTAQLVKALGDFDFKFDYYTRYLWYRKQLMDFVNFIQWLSSLNLPGEPLLTVDRWSTKEEPKSKKHVTIHHVTMQAQDFVAPILGKTCMSELYTIDLRLGRKRPVPLRLVIAEGIGVG
ncbi:hypothetical protein NP233_g5040 [Leucocoprinus birnbaumii]|uniref:Nephrocystin 3-like N-terminal domain-containing protein n=1 Tax=Leucocoprinus birnbaumii TaxID=56174 RepID=A0AAD5YS96_9AGAR|nr:hypothetical protein NP233_g5040 [Leucocoprinus birnbaumii]